MFNQRFGEPVVQKTILAARAGIRRLSGTVCEVVFGL
jgi:hypothetical protein